MRLQLTPRAGRTQKFVCQKSEATNFNSRPVWGRTRAKSVFRSAQRLQLTPPAQGRTHPGWLPHTSQSYFNSRPRVGANSNQDFPALADKTLIHAPCAGANAIPLCCLTSSSTFNSRPRRGEWPVHRRNARARGTSTHAPRVGGKQFFPNISKGFYKLQLTPRMGANAHEGALSYAGAGATTHAPVWGVRL